MATEQLVQGIEHAIKHIRADTPTGRTFIVAASAYQLLLGTRRNFFQDDPNLFPHRTPATSNRLTYLWEELSRLHCHLELPSAWMPDPERHTIMDAILQAQQRNRNTPNFITDEFVRLSNACRLWLRVIYLEDIASEDNELIMAYYTGDQQCDNHGFNMPYQGKTPQWVWTVWQEVLRKSCLTRCQHSTKWFIHAPIIEQPDVSTLIASALPYFTDRSLTLQEMVNTLPQHYQQILGEYQLPEDDGAALVTALALGNLSYYSDGSVKEGCASHAYTLRPQCDNDKLAITGGGPTCGDPDTVSSLRPEHSGTFAGSIWLWMLEFKHNVLDGGARSGIDNSAVITRFPLVGTMMEGRSTH